MYTYIYIFIYIYIGISLSICFNVPSNPSHTLLPKYYTNQKTSIIIRHSLYNLNLPFVNILLTRIHGIENVRDDKINSL